MREFFSPGIALLMHQRNKVKMPLAGILFSLPLLILVFERSIAWSSPMGIAIGVTYLLDALFPHRTGLPTIVVADPQEPVPSGGLEEPNPHPNAVPSNV